MTAKPHPITLDQLARLFDAANKANSELAAAHRAKPRDRDAVERARQRSSALNSAYDAAKRQYKRQKKAAQKVGNDDHDDRLLLRLQGSQFAVKSHHTAPVVAFILQRSGVFFWLALFVVMG